MNFRTSGNRLTLITGILDQGGSHLAGLLLENVYLMHGPRRHPPSISTGEAPA